MSGLTRRRFLQISGAGGIAVFLPIRFGGSAWAQPLPGATIEPTEISKYETPLVIPPQMPPTSRGPFDYYEIAVRQFQQQILPAGRPQTTVWSYGSVNHPDTSFNYPAFTIEANYHRPVRIKWINDLMDEEGNFLPHLLPVDQTLHWANPPGGTDGRDSRPEFTETPGPYVGPVPIVTHVHGNHARDHSDGYAEAWYLPAADNIPTGYAPEGTFYDYFRQRSPLGELWKPGFAVFEYPNDQRASTMWYHDHTLGMTRLNVYAGPAGFYLLRRGPGDLPTPVLPGPAPRLGDPADTRYYEIPLAIQDRSFNTDGSLFYPDTRAFFDEFAGPYIPVSDSDVPPIWNPEFFANTMVVNGNTWPVLEVEPRRYRFRLLNGCNSRFLILKLASDPTKRPADTALPLWMIGAEGGFLPEPVRLDEVLLAPAERADVIVDFSELEPGTTELYMINLGPDEPFGGGEFEPADPTTTGQVMKFTVGPLTSRDRSRPPDQLTLPAFKPLGPASNTRRVSLNEQASSVPEFDGPIAALLGTIEAETPKPLGWSDDITENPAVDAIEIWELHNFTEDAHPIHIHEVQFQVVNREPLPSGEPKEPEETELGFKDTVIAYPGEITRVKARFDLEGLYVWHCHIVEHEDNEMMRPYHVGAIPSDLP